MSIAGQVCQPTHVTLKPSSVAGDEFEWVPVARGTQSSDFTPGRRDLSATGSSGTQDNHCCKCDGGDAEEVDEWTGVNEDLEEGEDGSEDGGEDGGDYFVGDGSRDQGGSRERKVKGRKGKHGNARKGSRDMSEWHENVKGKWTIDGWDRGGGPNDDEDWEENWERRERENGRWSESKSDGDSTENEDGEWNDGWERRDTGKGRRDERDWDRNSHDSDEEEWNGSWERHSREKRSCSEHEKVKARKGGRSRSRGRHESQESQCPVHGAKGRKGHGPMHGRVTAHGPMHERVIAHGPMHGRVTAHGPMHGGGRGKSGRRGGRMRGGRGSRKDERRWEDESMLDGSESNDESMHGGGCPMHGGGCPMHGRHGGH